MQFFKSFLISLLFAIILFPQNYELNETIPFDETVIRGELENGLKYFIKKNKKPENRMALRLAVNAGSILEDDSQLGLAHFAEHMAFNGTENFRKHELIDYLELVGMKFGPEVNAYTSFDETVYMLEIPTESDDIINKGLQILEEWAHKVSFEDEEIDKERGVVIEEWRLGQGAWMRMMDKQFPIVFKNSRYAERLPIGKKEILESFEHETVREFYNEWYRPNLMAVIAVGDFDAEKIEGMIKKRFSQIPAKTGKEKEMFSVPGHQDFLFAIATDKEATQSMISLLRKLPYRKPAVVADIKEDILLFLFNGMLNERFTEIAQKPEAPFLYAYSSKGNFARSVNTYLMGAYSKEGELLGSFEIVSREAERVKRFGFTSSELERAKENLLKQRERYYDERDKMESSKIAAQYVQAFLNDVPSASIEYSYDVFKKYIPLITLEEVNEKISEFMGEDNNVLLVSAPEKEIIPSEEDFTAVIEKVKTEEISAYEDITPVKILIDNIPAEKSIIEETLNDEFGLINLILENGVRVILKPTDFKNDEILMQSFSNGGTSLIADKDYQSARYSASIITESGIGKFDKIQLQKALAGKSVRVYPYVGELSEGISGNTSAKDIETLFQLVYLYYTEPKLDSSAFLTFKNRMVNYLQNKDADPAQAYRDTLTNILNSYHFRREPMTIEKLNKIDPQLSFKIYKERFADAGDFTFIFVGSFDVEKMKQLCSQYLGNLPANNKKEQWKNLHIDPPVGIIKKNVFRGIEPKSKVSIHFSGPYEWSYQNNFNIYLLRNIMNIKLREILREDKGGTYGAGINSSGQKYPDEEYSFTISFGCAPERLDELVNDVFALIDTMQRIPVDDSYIKKVQEIERRTHEKDLKENNWWLNTLYRYSFYDMDLRDLDNIPGRIDNLTGEAMLETAKKYFNIENYIQVNMFPEGYILP